MKEKINELKENELITEFGMYDSDECIGIEEDDIYISITHHVDLFGNPLLDELCKSANIESTYCLDKETKMYETQIVFNRLVIQ